MNRNRIIKLFCEQTQNVVQPLYHISNQKFDSFDSKMTAQSINWFATDKDSLINDRHGAAINSREPIYLYTVAATVKKTAGWDEYDKLSIMELESMGYDSVLLDDDFVVFDDKNIKILKREQLKNEMDEARQVRIVRAQPEGTNVIRVDDYVTLSVKFAVEHAENNHIYEDVPHVVVTAIVDRDAIKDATNTDEYLSNIDVEGDIIYTSKGYEYEGFDSVAHEVSKYLKRR